MSRSVPSLRSGDRQRHAGVRRASVQGSIAVRDGKIAAILWHGRHRWRPSDVRRQGPARPARRHRPPRAHAAPRRRRARGLRLGHLGRGGRWHHHPVRDADLEGARPTRRRICETRVSRWRRRRTSTTRSTAAPAATTSTPIVEQAEAGAIAFKTFLQPPPAGREDEFRGLWCRHDEVRSVMDAVRLTGLRHCFHCEEPGMYEPLRARLESLGQTRGRAHADSRPAACEEASVGDRARSRRPRTAAAHRHRPLFERAIGQPGLRCPPARPQRDRRDLHAVPVLHHRGAGQARPVREVQPAAAGRPRRATSCGRRSGSGLIEYLGTDHSPFMGEDKERFGDDIFQAPPGIAGLEMFVPLMLTAVHERQDHAAAARRRVLENPALRVPPAPQGPHGGRHRRRLHHRGPQGTLALRREHGTDAIEART